MKKCELIRDLILTEYIDGAGNNSINQDVDSHIIDCNSCRQFLKEVKEQAVAPFQKISPRAVPEDLWYSIKENIEHQHQASNPFEEFIERLKGLIVFPKLVPIALSLGLMMLVGTVSMQSFQAQQVKAQDQGEYLVSLLSPTTTESNDGKTPIEQYFL